MIPDYSVASYVGDCGPDSFMVVGKQMIEWFKAYCDLEPSEHVLEVGCGIGRIAIPLTQYLTEGTYDGFDIVPRGIEWCQQRVTPLYPNFRFFLADIRNDFYNPNGKLSAAQYRFPFEDGSFDFVFLTSVFTHMLPDDVEHYVSEIGRVLRPNGRCFCTAYVLSDLAKDRIASGATVRRFEQVDRHWVESRSSPEGSLAYPETYLRELFRKSALHISRIVVGEWWTHATAQDILIVTKAAE